MEPETTSYASNYTSIKVWFHCSSLGLVQFAFTRVLFYAVHRPCDIRVYVGCNIYHSFIARTLVGDACA